MILFIIHHGNQSSFQAERLSLGDFYFSKFSGPRFSKRSDRSSSSAYLLRQIFRKHREVHKLEAVCPAAQCLLVPLALSLNHDGLHSAFIRLVFLRTGGINLIHKPIKPFVLDILWNLVFIGSGRRPLPDGIQEGKRGIILHPAHDIERILKIFFCFSRKTDDDISGNGNVRNCFFQPFYNTFPGHNACSFSLKSGRIQTVPAGECSCTACRRS